MNEVSISMAIVDFIPVVMFFVAIIYLQKDLAPHIEKEAYSLLAVGTAMVFIGGFYTAVWKILLALGRCDWQALNLSQMPLMAPGYVFIFAGMLTVVYGVEVKSYIIAIISVLLVPFFKSNIIFIIIQTLGCEGFYVLLMIQSKKKKKPSAMILFLVSAIFVLAMGYLGAKFDSSSSMHWLAQCTNIIAQGAFMLGVKVLHKAWEES